jgi:hypothetical protein
MARTLLTAVLLLATAALLPRTALALSLETPPANPDGVTRFANPDKKWEPFDYRSLSNRDGDNSSDNQPRGLTFGSPNSGAGSFSFTFGPVQQQNSPLDNGRFFRLGPPPGQPN